MLENSNDIKWQFCQLQTFQNHNSDRLTDLRAMRVLRIAVWRRLDSPCGFCHCCTGPYGSFPLCHDTLKRAFSNARQELWPSICLLNYPKHCWHWWQSVMKKLQIISGFPSLFLTDFLPLPWLMVISFFTPHPTCLLQTGVDY